MHIKVRSYAYYRKYTAHLPHDGGLEVPEGSTVGDVLASLKVPSDSGRIVLVNGRHSPEDRILQAGDLLVFYPLLEGG